MRRLTCILMAVMLLLGGTVQALAVEETSEDGVQKLQTMEHREGEALVKVSVSKTGARTRLFAGGAFEVETLMDFSELGVEGSGEDAEADAGERQSSDENRAEQQSGQQAPLLQSDQAAFEEKILLVKSDSLTTEELIETLEQYDQVEYAEPNYVFSLAGITNDTYIDSQWYLQNGADAVAGSAKAATVWESSTTGNQDSDSDDVPVVAVIDSGVDYEHEDLNTDGSKDNVGHGTHIAGIIGATHNNSLGISGVSKQVKLMALKITDNNKSFDSAAAVKAYDYMLEQKNAGVNIIAANNSWGGYYYSRILEEVFDAAGQLGIVSVAAAGNDSIDHDTNLNSPEGGDRTMYLLVSASDEYGKAAGFSDYGLVSTDLYAPGMNILSTVMTGGSPSEGNETPGYGSSNGTSCSAAVVTGAIALLYDYYDYDKENLNDVQQREAQKEALAEIRARIAGGVTRTEEMKSLCASGGYLNLEKAINSPYPILDALEQNGSEATITGYFFGTTGTLEMDGTEMTVTSWSDSAITFTIPEGTGEGLHEFKITDKSKAEYGNTQYGRDKLWTEAISETSSGEFFEKLTAPDFASLNVTSPVEEGSYIMAAYDGKIYVAQKNLYLKGTQQPAILVYDEASGTWSVAGVSGITLEEDATWELTAGKDALYLVTSRGIVSGGEEKTRLQVYKMTAQGDFEATGDVFDNDLSKDYSVCCDGESIWIAGGRYSDSWRRYVADARILRFDLTAGQWEKTEISLNTARYNAVAEVTQGKLIVTSGINKSGNLEQTTEIIDLKTGQVTPGAQHPAMEASQEVAMASAAYDGKLIISGMFDTAEHTADTYIYDLATDTWQTLEIRLLDTKVFLLDGAVSGEYFYVYGVASDGSGKEAVFRRLKVRDLSEDADSTDGESTDDEATDEEYDQTENDDLTESDNQAENVDSKEKVEDGGKDGSSQKKGFLNTGDSFNILAWLTLMTLAVTVAVGMALSAGGKYRR